jgi:hypothetical protein
MTLPASGPIAILANVQKELGGSGPLNLENASVRSLYGIASGAINMKAGYGKSSFNGVRPSNFAVTICNSPCTVANTGNIIDSDPSTYATLTCPGVNSSRIQISLTGFGNSGIISHLHLIYEYLSVDSTQYPPLLWVDVNDGINSLSDADGYSTTDFSFIVQAATSSSLIGKKLTCDGDINDAAFAYFQSYDYAWGPNPGSDAFQRSSLAVNLSLLPTWNAPQYYGGQIIIHDLYVY